MISRETVEMGEDRAVLITEYLHGTQRRVYELVKPAMIMPDIKIEGGKADLSNLEVKIDWSKVDLNAVTDQIILGQVEAWHFSENTANIMGNDPGAAPVNRENLDRLPQAKYEILKNRIDEVFADALPLPENATSN